ncbi:uncharacterized protein CDAR_188762 [Caerostris darwini]|uniref:Ig-like domain-containing protein n=1 Tax=Caerostris darwini TaxID=1538125 RepID=A0AAV4VMJ6_9ARAC|nr:uncharacterized protein CDAR_188762 [Caerostris darwini]
MMKIHYTPRCRSVRSSVYGVGKSESVSVSCEIDASPSNVTFTWALNDEKVFVPDQYRTNLTRSVITVSPKDYGILTCWATNIVGRQKEPCTFRIFPAVSTIFLPGPPEEPGNCAITNNSTVHCIILECEGGHDGVCCSCSSLRCSGLTRISCWQT